MRTKFLLTATLLAASTAATTVARADAVDAIRARGSLRCAISVDTDDYSQFDAHGDLSAFSRDLCRAVAAALLPDGTRTTILETGDEITAVRDVHDNRADIAFGTTPDPALGYGLAVAYGPPLLFDGQGFLAKRDEHLTDIASLHGQRICFVEGEPPGETLKVAMAEHHVAFTAFPFSERGEMIGALATGRCTVATGDLSELASQRLNLPALRRNGVLLPDTVTVDPWSPVVRADERRLLAVLQALADGLVAAETLGIGQADAMRLAAHPDDPAVARLLGASTWEARGFGLDERFLLRAIEAVGNYGELFRRDVGAGSPLDLPVGVNRPVATGGAVATIPIAGAR